MAEDRPYLANYAIGLIFVMSLHLLLNGITALLFPELFDDKYLSGETYQIIFIGLGIMEFVVFLLMYMESGIGYKLAIIIMITVMTLTIFDVLGENVYGFDILLQLILGTVVLFILLTPNVREYYRNWSLGKIPNIDA